MGRACGWEREQWGVVECSGMDGGSFMFVTCSQGTIWMHICEMCIIKHYNLKDRQTGMDGWIDR